MGPLLPYYLMPGLPGIPSLQSLFARDPCAALARAKPKLRPGVLRVPYYLGQLQRVLGEPGLHSFPGITWKDPKDPNDQRKLRKFKRKL
jgi:hypothetical protein